MSKNTPSLRLFVTSLSCLVGTALLLTSCITVGRGGGDDDDGGNGDSCFTDVDCTAGEEYCKADDPASSPEGACTALEPAGGPCLWGSQCSGDLFCLVDSSEDEGTCRAAPSSCTDGPACNCEPMLEMCAPGGLSCDGSNDSVTLHCNNGVGGGLGDDDDDEDAATSHDDDTTSDDDDATGTLSFDALTFSFEMTANPGAGGSTGIAATFKFTYWSDGANQIIDCEQSISIEGTADFGSSVAGCGNCIGKIDFDDSTASDVSAGTGSPDACSAVALDEAGANLGTALLSTITNGGYGDFLSIALIDAGTMGGLNLDLASAGGYSASEISAALGNLGLTFTHAGYSSNEVGTMSEASSLDSVAANAGSGSTWYGYWMIGATGANSHSGTDLNGSYAAQAVWQIGFN